MLVADSLERFNWMGSHRKMSEEKADMRSSCGLKTWNAKPTLPHAIYYERGHVACSYLSASVPAQSAGVLICGNAEAKPDDG